MSLILDALKRAERERRGEPAPVLEGAPPAAGPRPSSLGRWRLLGIGALVLVLAALGWSLWHKPSAPESQPGPIKEAAVPTPGFAPVPATQSPPAQPLPESAPAVIPGIESVASLEEVTEGVVEAPVVPPAPVSPTPEPASRAEAPPAVETAPAPQAVVEPETARPIPPALTQPAPVRRLREMPPDYRADFPALTVEVHVFERSPAQRFVMVNGRRYKEGERMSEGPQILEIVREGIVVEFRGQKVLYPLGR